MFGASKVSRKRKQNLSKKFGKNISHLQLVNYRRCRQKIDKFRVNYYGPFSTYIMYSENSLSHHKAYKHREHYILHNDDRGKPIK